MYRISYSSQPSLFKKILIVIVLIVLLIGAFFVTMALLPFILVVLAYLAYRLRKGIAKMREANKNFVNRMNNSFDTEEQESTVRYIYTNIDLQEQSTNRDQEAGQTIYDISPENYTVEEKK